MSKPLFRGLLITALFSVVGVVLLPIYVPRPAFIPGFAPPPDMWPRTIAVMGGLLGLLAISQSMFDRSSPDDPPAKTDGASTKTMLLRAAAFACVLAGFVLLVPVVGFAIGATLLTGTSILLTGERHHVYWALAISLLGPLLLLLFFQKALGTQFPQSLLISAFGL